MMMSRSVERSVELWEYQCPGIAFPWSPAGATLKNKTFLYVFGALFTFFLPPLTYTLPTLFACLPQSTISFYIPLACSCVPCVCVCACACVCLCDEIFTHLHNKDVEYVGRKKEEEREEGSSQQCSRGPGKRVASRIT